MRRLMVTCGLLFSFFTSNFHVLGYGQGKVIKRIVIYARAERKWKTIGKTVIDSMVYCFDEFSASSND